MKHGAARRPASPRTAMKIACYAAIILALLATSCVPGGFYRDEWRYGWFSRMRDGERIVRTARRYIGVPYRHGGETPRGFDCSGYVVYVYRQNGILLPRSAARQYRAGMKISLRRAAPGDLLFFNTSGKRYSHVGIYAGNGRFLHAPRTGKRISYADLDNPYWKRRYTGAVTFLRGHRM